MTVLSVIFERIDIAKAPLDVDSRISKSNTEEEVYGRCQKINAGIEQWWGTMALIKKTNLPPPPRPSSPHHQPDFILFNEVELQLRWRDECT